ncbi:catalase 1 [Saitoella coloradoensis]
MSLQSALETMQEVGGGLKAKMAEKANALSSNAKIKQLGQYTVTPESTRDNCMTTNTGVKVANTDDWLKVISDNGTGPHILEDFHAREKIHHFDHERIPERVVHARGAGAHGVFRLFESAADVTCAKVLTDTSRETPMFVRFSTVLGSRGSADTVRDVRGFAIRFYTEEGNWDIVGNNIPVFFIQDSIKFPDVIHSGKPEPSTEVPQAQSAHNNFWDFMGLQPETSHMFMWAMSDRGIPRSYRMMQGFGVNTFALINEQGERTFVKFVWTPDLGVHSLVWDEALKIAGQDPDFHRKDLYAAIDNGAYPKWKFGIQCIKEADADNFDFDILDSTKLWPEQLVPVRYIGEFELNRNVTEYFPETEQVAFCTSHIVPGIDFTDDPLLQGRNFSYLDTQLNRFGSFNFNELPINKPLAPTLNNQRDGFMRHTITEGKVNYWPNRYSSIKPTPPSGGSGGFETYRQEVNGFKQRKRGPKFYEHLNQATQFYNSMRPHEKRHMTNSFVFELSKCDDPQVYTTMIERLNMVSFELACTVATQVGVAPPEKPFKTEYPTAAIQGVSQAELTGNGSIEGRRVAILIADGFDLGQVTEMRTALAAQKAVTFIVGERRGPIKAAGQEESSKYEEGLGADFSWESGRSTLFDSIYVPGGAGHILKMKQSGRVTHWVREAFEHLKPICATGEGVDFIQQAVVLPGVDLALSEESTEVINSYGVITSRNVGLTNIGDVAKQFSQEMSQHRNWAREDAGLNLKVAA